jgi:hypothetical protein
MLPHSPVCFVFLVIDDDDVVSLMTVDGKAGIGSTAIS